MRAIDLDWKTTEHTGKRVLHTGDELYRATFGKWSRFQIAECYQFPRGGEPERNLYVLRDADRVTDAEVREGKRSPIVARSYDPQRLIDFALEQSV